MADWPMRPDGTNKTVGEMTKEERRNVFSDAGKKIEAWFSRPEVKAGLAAALSGDMGKPH